MIQSIINGICEQLDKAFGKGYKIYTEAVRQGLSEPCFFVQLRNHSSTREMKNKFNRPGMFEITYFPSTKEPNAECYRALEALYLALEYITVDGSAVRGIGARGEVNDGILYFNINYDLRVMVDEEAEPMEILEKPNITQKG